MTNIKEPLFRPDPARPGEFLVSMPGLLLLAAGSAYEADDNEVTPEGRAVGQRTVASILSAARAGGFTQGEVLETLLARARCRTASRSWPWLLWPQRARTPCWRSWPICGRRHD